MHQQSSAVDAVIESSFLAHLSGDLQRDLVSTGRLLHLPRGHLLVDGYRDFGGIVTSGVLRAYAEVDRTGRSVTYRNVERGDAVGLAALLGLHDEIWVQTVTEATVFSLDLGVVARLRQSNAAFALALAEEVMRRLQDTSRELQLWVRGTVRQRTVRRLLDLVAESSPNADPNWVAITHEELAESISSRREVVTRVLRELEERDLVRRGRGGVSILDVPGLRTELERI